MRGAIRGSRGEIRVDWDSVFDSWYVIYDIWYEILDLTLILHSKEIWPLIYVCLTKSGIWPWFHFHFDWVRDLTLTPHMWYMISNWLSMRKSHRIPKEKFMKFLNKWCCNWESISSCTFLLKLTNIISKLWVLWVFGILVIWLFHIHDFCYMLLF